MEVYHWATVGNEYAEYWQLFIYGKLLHQALSIDRAFLRLTIKSAVKMQAVGFYRI